MKTCFKCLQSLPLESFYRHPRMGDGYLNKCKECTKADTLAHRLNKIDHYRSYDRMRASQPHRKALAKRVNSEWLAKYPNRRAAQVQVGNALRRGELKRQPCHVCGSAAEAHHPDYERPLDVVWLCPPHHKQAHALIESEPA